MPQRLRRLARALDEKAPLLRLLLRFLPPARIHLRQNEKAPLLVARNARQRRLVQALRRLAHRLGGKAQALGRMQQHGDIERRAAIFMPQPGLIGRQAMKLRHDQQRQQARIRRRRASIRRRSRRG